MIGARVIALGIGYLFGLFQTGYLYGKSQGIDIRSEGSGNAGTTNSLRVLGIKAGLITFAGDLCKAILAVLLVKVLFRNAYPDAVKILELYAGFGAVLGHNFPFYLKFKGGKGIAAMLGMMLGVFPFPALAVYIIAIAILLTGYVSVTSLVLSVLIPVSLHIWNYPREVVILTSALAVLAFIQHRANIKRLLNGTESRFEGKEKRQ